MTSRSSGGRCIDESPRIRPKPKAKTSQTQPAFLKRPDAPAPARRQATNHTQTQSPAACASLPSNHNVKEPNHPAIADKYPQAIKTRSCPVAACGSRRTHPCSGIAILRADGRICLNPRRPERIYRDARQAVKPAQRFFRSLPVLAVGAGQGGTGLRGSRPLVRACAAPGLPISWCRAASK